MNLPDTSDPHLEKVLILGAGGHDGPFLSDILSQKYSVVGHARRRSVRLDSIKIPVTFGDIASIGDLRKVIFDARPDHVVNLISLSSVFECEAKPKLSTEINYYFVRNLFQVLNEYSTISKMRPKLLQASSSEIFGKSDHYCTESTPLNPVSQYGYDKARAHEFLEVNATQNIDIKRAILFNHESEFRGPNFVSQKIARAAAKFRLGLEYNLTLGNTSASRDWGYAPDYMRAVSMMLDNPGDETCIIASGQLHSIEDMIKIAFLTEEDFDISTLYSIDESLFRKRETGALVGSSERISKMHGWKPKVPFSEMIKLMVNFQIHLLQGTRVGE